MFLTLTTMRNLIWNPACCNLVMFVYRTSVIWWMPIGSGWVLPWPFRNVQANQGKFSFLPVEHRSYNRVFKISSTFWNFPHPINAKVERVVICSALALKVICTHPPSVLYVCLLGPSTTLQYNEPVPQVSKLVVNLSCYSSNQFMRVVGVKEPFYSCIDACKHISTKKTFSDT